MKILYLSCALIFSFSLYADHEPWVKTEFPQDKNKSWWDDDWWGYGTLEIPQNYEVSVEEISYESGDETIPAYVYRPKKAGKYPAVLFQHGRRGIDELTRLIPKRLAARGFVVLAPDVYTGRFIDRFPFEHDYENDKDVAIGIDTLLALENIEGEKACVVTHTRGGYMTLKALVTHKRQENAVACYVAYYPHWQDPNKPEPMQVYQHAPEINDLTVPVLAFIGEHDQYQRVRSMVESINSLKAKGRKPEFIVYPGVGRGFDFRPPNVRTFADDLATKDSLQRTAKFIHSHLKP